MSYEHREGTLVRAAGGSCRDARGGSGAGRGADGGRRLRRPGAALPLARGFEAIVRFAVNSEYVPASHPVRDGDEVALIPPVSGGSRAL
ncbi:MAG: MoaD/ThiS family protein [Chloroflexi bacterium]|nr:MoaD/ThiS family protein [Chloroflexota bacterium]